MPHDIVLKSSNTDLDYQNLMIKSDFVADYLKNRGVLRAITLGYGLLRPVPVLGVAGELYISEFRQ